MKRYLALFLGGVITALLSAGIWVTQFRAVQAAEPRADLVAYVESIQFRRPSTPRFPIATLDPRVSFDPQLSQTRMAELMAD